VNRVIRNEREHCCDDVAVSACGNAPGYARALALLEESRSSSVWAMAANGGVLTSRIGRLLGIKGVTSAISTSGLVFIGSLCVAGILMAGTASTQVTSDLPPPTPPDPPALPADPPAAPAAPAAPVVLDAPAIPSVPSIPSIPSAPHVHLSGISPVAPVEAPRAPHTPKAPATPKAPTASTADPGEGGSYIGGLQSAGLKELTVEEIIALKIHGVTPEYIRGMRAAGLEAGPRELVALKVQDVTPEFVSGLAAAGLTNLHIHDYLSAKVQGITPEFAQKIRSHGFKDLTIHQLISLKVAGIS
jgi:hypothetical protein